MQYECVQVKRHIVDEFGHRPNSRVSSQISYDSTTFTTSRRRLRPDTGRVTSRHRARNRKRRSEARRGQPAQTMVDRRLYSRRPSRHQRRLVATAAPSVSRPRHAAPARATPAHTHVSVSECVHSDHNGRSSSGQSGRRKKTAALELRLSHSFRPSDSEPGRRQDTIARHYAPASRPITRSKNPTASTVSSNVTFAGLPSRPKRSITVRPRLGPGPRSTVA